MVGCQVLLTGRMRDGIRVIGCSTVYEDSVLGAKAYGLGIGIALRSSPKLEEAYDASSQVIVYFLA